MYKNFENDYLIYDDGKVFSLKRNAFQKPRKHSNGYMRATIHGKDMYIHRLVALCFLDNPNNYCEVNHKDGNKQNNDLSNLEWCDRSQNNKHAFDIGLRSRCELSKMSNSEKAINARKIRRKYSEDEIREIREYISKGLTDRQIKNKVGGSRGAIYQIRTGKSYKEVV